MVTTIQPVSYDLIYLNELVVNFIKTNEVVIDFVKEQNPHQMNSHDIPSESHSVVCSLSQQNYIKQHI